MAKRPRRENLLIYQIKFRGLIGNIYENRNPYGSDQYTWTICHATDLPGDWFDAGHFETHSHALCVLYRKLLGYTGKVRESSPRTMNQYENDCERGFHAKAKTKPKK